MARRMETTWAIWSAALGLGGALALAVLAGAGAIAAEPAPAVDAKRPDKTVLDLGDAAPPWKLRGTDDKEHALEDYARAKVLVVCFTCNTCPYAVDYEDRIIAVAKKYAGQDVQFVAINANRKPDDQMPAMQQRAEEKDFPYPYLHDDTQHVAKSHGAVWTPEFFVFDGARRLIYAGALDDNADETKTTRPYVDEAIAAALAGKEPPTTKSAPVGCRILYDSPRRKR